MSVTSQQLSDDDTNTMAAAMTQAKTTNKNVTVTLSDGTQFTATPTDLDAAASSKWTPYIIAGGVVIVGAFVVAAVFGKRGKS